MGQQQRVMGGNDHGHADLLEGTKDFENFACRSCVQVRGRLVSEDDCRSIDDGAGNCQTLLLAAGERDRKGFLTIRQPTLASAALRTTQRFFGTGWPTIASGSSTLSRRCDRTSSFRS
jgi:hypothetical protein